MPKPNNQLAEKFSESYPWECIANHLPKWTDDPRLEDLISNEDHKRIMGLIDRYNELSKKEETVDAHEAFGIESEKTDLIESLLKILTRYKEVVLSSPEEISKFLYPDNEEKRKIWLEGYGYATSVFAPDFAKLHTIKYVERK